MNPCHDKMKGSPNASNVAPITIDHDSDMADDEIVINSDAVVIQQNTDIHRKRILAEHSYALNMKFKPELYQCDCDSKYSTNVRQHFYTHRAEHCSKTKNERNKTETCEICKKKFTHNGLRSHYRNYTEPTRFPRGIHAKFSIRYHLKLLKKMSKQRN